MNFKSILKLLAIPLSLSLVYLTMLVIWKSFHFPEGDDLFNATAGYINKYGLWLVFVSAIIEGFLLLGQYYPGGAVIFLGVISAGKNIPRVAEVVAIVSLAFFIAYTLNYIVGKYGWYKLFLKFGLKKPLDNSQAKLAKHQFNAILFSYWEPNLASVTATAAGVLNLPLLKFSFYSLIGIIVWNTIWGTLVASLGKAAFKLMGLKYVILVVVIWIAVILIKHFFIDKKQPEALANINIP